MKPSKTASSTVVLEKDSKGYIHVKLYKDNGKGMEITTLSTYPKNMGMEKISRTILFLKEKYIPVLMEAGIITSFFHSTEGYWCGMIDINIYFELDNSPNGQYTVKTKN